MNESIKYEIEELPIKNEQIQLHYIIYTLIFAVLILFIYKFIKKMNNKKKKKYILYECNTSMFKSYQRFN